MDGEPYRTERLLVDYERWRLVGRGQILKEKLDMLSKVCKNLNIYFIKNIDTVERYVCCKKIPK